MDKAFLIRALVIALFCGALGAFLIHRRRQKSALAYLAWELDQAFIVAEGLTQHEQANSSISTRQPPRIHVHVSPGVKQAYPSRLRNALSSLWRFLTPANKKGGISVATLVLKVQELRQVIEGAQRVKKPSAAIRPAARSHGMASEPNSQKDVNRNPEYDITSYEYDEPSCGTEPLARDRTPARITTAKQPTIARRKDADSAPRLGSAVDTLLQLYNSAVEDRGLRSNFRGKFQPIRIGTLNAPERRRDPNLPAEFREASDGNFFAVKLEGQSDYLVVLGFDVTVKHTSFEAGAIGQIFECPGYDPDLSYLSVKVRRPAVFKVSGQNWELRHQGELELGPGE